MDVYHFPPYLYLFQVVVNCPKSAALYLQLWQESRLNENFTITVYKDEVRENFFTTNTLFKNHLLALSKEGVIHVSEGDSGLTYKITFLDHENLMNTSTAC